MRSAATSKIILHTPEPKSGAAKYVAQLAIALRRAGMPVALFCPANFVYADHLGEAGVEIVTAPARDVSEAGVWKRLTRNLSFVARALFRHHCFMQRGDVVHFQFPLRLPLGVLFYWSAWLKGAAVVLTAHDPLPHRWRLPSALRWAERALMGLEYRSCQGVVVHNRIGREVLTADFGVPADRVFVVPHGPDGAAPAAMQFPRFDEFRLLSFGSIRENKGLHFAIEAVQRLRRENVNPVRLTITGSPETMAECAYWQRCKRMIEAAPGGFEIREGFVPDDEVAPLMGSHHAVLLPYSEFHSESGVAALALSHARPMIATASGGLGELMEAAGVGVPIGNPSTDAVTSAINAAFSLGPQRLEAMGTAGKRYVENARSWERIAEMTGEVYRQARGGRQRAARIFLHTPEPESSAARYVRELLDALTEQGVAVDVICPVNHRAMPNFRSNPRITVHASRGRSTSSGRGVATRVRDNVEFALSSATVLYRAARRGDLIHFQYAIHLPLQAVFLACARLRGCKIVFTAHDPLPHKWSLPRPLRWLERSALRWIYRTSDVILVHSEAGKRTVLAHFAEPEAKVQVIPHGPYPLNTKVSHPDSGRMELLLFGALRENKGLHLAIQAVQRLHRSHNPVRLTIAGRVMNGKEHDYWERCKALIAADPEPIRVIEEFIPEERVPELLSGCHCLVLPYGAFFSDSGVAFLALANSKPLLATSSGGLGELLRSSGGGILIDEATVDAVEIAIRSAIGMKPEELQQMGRDGSCWVLRECGWPNIARQTRQIYATVPRRSEGMLALAAK